MFFLSNETVSFISLLQSTSLILLITSLILGILCVRKFSKISLFVLPILTWIGHGIIFYSFVLYDIFIKNILENIVINGWSAGLRFHLVLILLVEFIIILLWGKKWIQ